MQREVLTVQSRVLGSEHPDTLLTACRLATALSQQGKFVEAEEVQRQVHGAQTRRLGAEHPSTLRTAFNLAAYTFRVHPSVLPR